MQRRPTVRPRPLLAEFARLGRIYFGRHHAALLLEHRQVRLDHALRLLFAREFAPHRGIRSDRSKVTAVMPMIVEAVKESGVLVPTNIDPRFPPQSEPLLPLLGLVGKTE